MIQESQSFHTPSHLLLQWHITERCNLSCYHCYQNPTVSNDLSYKQLLEIYAQYKELHNTWNHRVKGQINITGGEPFLRDDFWDLASIIKESYPFAVLSNGTLISKSIAKELSQLKPKFVQISIDGSEFTHNKIRGNNSYRMAAEGLKQLRRYNVPTIISFTANKENYQDFPAVVKLGQRYQVLKVWADRMIPEGLGAKMSDTLLSTEETTHFYSLMNRCRIRANLNPFSQTFVSMKRALQFLETGKKGYKCSAGDSLLTVDAEGNLLPCRRMPIKEGNLLRSNMKELYFNSNNLQKLRNSENLDPLCKTCDYFTKCYGGLRCLSFAVYNDPYIADPNCPFFKGGNA